MTVPNEFDEPEPDDERLFEGGRKLITSIVALAQVCTGSSDSRWNAMLDKLGVSESELRALRSTSRIDLRGVPVHELRVALEAGVAPLWSFMADGSRLRELVEDTLRRYEAALE